MEKRKNVHQEKRTHGHSLVTTAIICKSPTRNWPPSTGTASTAVNTASMRHTLKKLS
jgi:hypothetical protein